jgi:hypothetical protein
VRALTSKRLAEAFRPVEEGLAILDDDPNSKLSSEVSRNVLEAMQGNREMKKNESLSDSSAVL